VYILVTREDTHLYYNKFRVDLKDANEFEPHKEFGFDIAFGLGEPLNPTIGSFNV
jgi:hypothetical protein